jgi:hypothetical protein
MKKKFVFFILGLIFFVFTKHVYAHILQTDGTIGAVMHIDPNDDPIAGKQASFFFEFKDTTNKFDPKNCDCKMTIVEHNHTIYAQPLFANTSSSTIFSASGFYTLPQPDVYQIILTGTPLSNNAFQSFKLTYVVRAEPPDNTSPTPPTSNFFTTHIGHFIAGILLFLVVLGVAIYNYKDHKSIFPKP